MKHSKTYLEYSGRINQPNPELLLGPNWKDVLNFWLFLDTLSPEQLEIVKDRYYELNVAARDAARDSAWNAAWAALNVAYDAWEAAYDAVRGVPGVAAGWATYELIGSHKILRKNIPLTFLPLFLNL